MTRMNGRIKAIAGIVALTAAVGVGVGACSNPAPSLDGQQTQAPVSQSGTVTAEQIASRLHLNKQADYAAYNATTDPNSLLGRQGQYTSKVSWAGYANDNGSGGGTIEAFSNVADAQTRLDYVKGFQAPFGDGYDYMVGTVLLRLSADYTPAQASAMHAALVQAASLGRVGTMDVLIWRNGRSLAALPDDFSGPVVSLTGDECRKMALDLWQLAAEGDDKS